VRDNPPLPREVNPRVPAALEAVIMKAMAKDPAARYGSAEELRADLLRFAEGRPVEAGDPGLTSVIGVVGAGAAAAATTSMMSTAGRTMAVPASARPSPDSREDEERKKRTRRLVILLIALLVLLGIIAFFLLRSVLGANVNVPNVVGETQAAATQTLQNENLTVGTTTYQTNNTAKGLVLSTDPKAGTSVSKNSAVNLVVSNGPNIPTVQVPDVTGEQLAPAIQKLSAANLHYTVKYETSNQAVGIVLSQNPVGGSNIKANIPVQLTVSGNQTSVSVPSVLGQSPANAGSILSQHGLNVGSQNSGCNGQYSSGVVASQSPGPGVSAPPNSAVNLMISNCVSVPAVIGQFQNAAEGTLSGAGFNVSATSDATCANGATNGQVDNQNPVGGALAAPGSTVAIAVCHPTPPTTTQPTTSPTTTATSTPNATGNSGPGGHGRGGGGG
jgi:serine/threonine-protein kinase